MSRGSDCSSRPATAGCRERRSTGRKIEARFGLLLKPGPPNVVSIGRSVFKTVGRFEGTIVPSNVFHVKHDPTLRASRSLSTSP
ncbi:hypothetical protein RN2511_027000 [Rhodococcus sp. NKCM2511]|nr:hypothetical protein RN2511_027000 [Rhodococcus sp. NKCM2511]